jgi:hypothetical protein
VTSKLPRSRPAVNRALGGPVARPGTVSAVADLARSLRYFRILVGGRTVDGQRIGRMTLPVLAVCDRSWAGAWSISADPGLLVGGART